MKLSDAASVRRFAVDLTALTLLMTGGLCLLAAAPAATAATPGAQPATLKFEIRDWRCVGCALGGCDDEWGPCNGGFRPGWCTSCRCVGTPSSGYACIKPTTAPGGPVIPGSMP